MTRVLSLGAGRQSTALLLMSCEGVLPKLDFAIFSDTGWEPPEVYEHLDALTRYATDHGIEVHRACRGSLPDDVLDRQVFATIPAWTVAEDGKRGRIKRQCTPKYKVEPLEQKMRELLGAPVFDQPCSYCNGTGARIAPWDPAAGVGPCSVCRGSGTRRRVGSVPKGVTVEQWIGFSADEFERATDLGFPSWAHVRHPLIELGWTVQDCIRWMAERGWKGVTKSACQGCPFHDDETWLRMADNDPGEFAKVVAYDAQMRTAAGLDSQRFLHEARLPLAEAVERYRRLKVESGEQGVLWEQYRAKRKIRRCNPFGCRSEEVDDDLNELPEVAHA